MSFKLLFIPLRLGREQSIGSEILAEPNDQQFTALGTQMEGVVWPLPTQILGFNPTAKSQKVTYGISKIPTNLRLFYAHPGTV